MQAQADRSAYVDDAAEQAVRRLASELADRLEPQFRQWVQEAVRLALTGVGAPETLGEARTPHPSAATQEEVRPPVDAGASPHVMAAELPLGAMSQLQDRVENLADRIEKLAELLATRRIGARISEPRVVQSRPGPALAWIGADTWWQGDIAIECDGAWVTAGRALTIRAQSYPARRDQRMWVRAWGDEVSVEMEMSYKRGGAGPFENNNEWEAVIPGELVRQGVLWLRLAGEGPGGEIVAVERAPSGRLLHVFVRAPSVLGEEQRPT